MKDKSKRIKVVIEYNHSRSGPCERCGKMNVNDKQLNPISVTTKDPRLYAKYFDMTINPPPVFYFCDDCMKRVLEWDR